MTEEERFQHIKNIYMNYEHEFAQRGMEDVAPIAASLTQAYILHDMIDALKGLPLAINLPYLDEEHLLDDAN